MEDTERQVLSDEIARLKQIIEDQRVAIEQLQSRIKDFIQAQETLLRRTH